MKMKIAFFADNFYPELSGIADTILLTGSELARRGHEIHYFVPRYSARDYKIVSLPKKELALGNNIKIHRVSSLHYPTPTTQGRLAIPNIFRALKNEKFDAIHTHSFFGPGLDSLLFSRLKKIPLVGTNHTIIEEFVRYSPINSEWVRRSLLNYIKWFYNHCDFVSTPSNFLADNMKKNGLKSRIEAISNPIESGFVNPGQSKEILKEELGFSPFTILHAGRISAEKGVDTLFKGFESFAKEAPEAMLVIVGQGTMRKELEERARKNGLGSRVKFMGPYLGENKKILYDIFHASDIFATASTSESQCMSMMQALAAGIPVIGARAAALPEYIKPGHGFLFRPGDQIELALHFKTLYESESIRKQYSKNAREYARQFSIAEIASRWESVYNNVIDKKHVKP